MNKEIVEVYAVMCQCQFYEEPHIDKAFFSEQKATEYVEKQRAKFDSKNGWYVEVIDVEK